MSVEGLGGSQCLATLAKACMPPWKVAPIILMAEPREPESKGLKDEHVEWGNTAQRRKLDTLD